MVTLSIIAVFFYSLGSLQQSVAIGVRQNWGRAGVLLLGLVACVIHAYLLHAWIDIVQGQNLDMLNMLSLMCWLLALFVIVLSLFKPVDILAVGVFPLAALSIVFVLMFSRKYIVNTSSDPITLFHILASVFTSCVLFMAGLVAILLALQEQLLRYNKFNFLRQYLPSLELMEGLLFQIIMVGFVLLSVVLVTSFYFYYQIVFSFDIFPKLLAVCVAWLVFFILLIGRYFWGWRGRKVIYATLTGAMLLLLAYFGSRIILKVGH